MYGFITWCVEKYQNRPTAKQLLECDFLKEVESEATNNPVKLKSKHGAKIKTSKTGAKHTEVSNHIDQTHVNTHKPEIDHPPMQIVIEARESEIKTEEPETNSGSKQAKFQHLAKNDDKNDHEKQAEKESLDLFEKIEAEKYQRLHIDESNMMSNEEPTLDNSEYSNYQNKPSGNPNQPKNRAISSEIYYERRVNQDHEKQQHIIENNLNKSQDIAIQESHDNGIQQHYDSKQVARANTSYENKSADQESIGYATKSATKQGDLITHNKPIQPNDPHNIEDEQAQQQQQEQQIILMLKAINPKDILTIYL